MTSQNSLTDFLEHQERLPKLKQTPNGGDGLVLFELNHFFIKQIGYSYFARFYRNERGFQCVPYLPIPEWSHVKVYESIHLLYSSLGINGPLVSPSFNSVIQSRATSDLKKILPLINPHSILRIVIRGYPLGDLIYNSVLYDFKLPTFPYSQEVVPYIYKFLCLFNYWESFLDRFQVRAVVFSHLVYRFGILPRLASFRGIDAISPNEDHVIRYDKSMDPGLKDSTRDVRFFFNGLKSSERSLYVEMGKRIVDAHLSGSSKKLDPKNGGLSPFSSQIIQPQIKRRGGVKNVLVCVHAFSDAPINSFNPLSTYFNDMYIWLEFILKELSTLPYDVYLKQHRKVFPHDDKAFRDLLHKFPQFRLVDSNSSFKQLFQEGVDLVITHHGTIGMEAPGFGQNVMSTSNWSRHRDYPINHYPQSREEIRQLLANPELWPLEVSLNDIYEMYFFSTRWIGRNWLDVDVTFYDKFVSVGYTPDVFGIWVENFEVDRYFRIMETLGRFLSDSSARVLNFKHIGRTL